jgi:hypothetical protein
MTESLRLHTGKKGGLIRGKRLERHGSSVRFVDSNRRERSHLPAQTHPLAETQFPLDLGRGFEESQDCDITDFSRPAPDIKPAFHGGFCVFWGLLSPHRLHNRAQLESGARASGEPAGNLPIRRAS